MQKGFYWDTVTSTLEGMGQVTWTETSTIQSFVAKGKGKGDPVL
jgi:hypothetical protein